MPGRLPVRGAAEPAIVLSIIIGTYNARDLLVDCLESIYRDPPREPFEIIVVDDASTGGTSETVRARFPEIRLLRNEINRNHATADNQALELARGRYIYLLNNDTIVLPDALDGMLAFLREQPDAGAVGSKVLNEDGTIQWTVKSLPSMGAALFGARSIISRFYPDNRVSRKQLLHLGRNMTTPFVAGYVSGASVMHPREVVEKVGELDKRLFYFVDADYCKRIADAGYKCYYLPTTTIIHLSHKGGSMSSFRRRFRSVWAFHVASYIYYRIHVRRSPWSLMNVVVLGGLFARFLVALSTQACTEVIGLMGSFRRQRRPVR
jgi:GT2 family glycosyltransferase